MPTSIYIHLDKNEPGFDTWDGSGVAVSDHMIEIHEITTKLKLRSPDDFLSVGFRGDLEDPEAGLDEYGNPLPDCWFTAEEGLEWVRTVREYVRAHPEEIDGPPLLTSCDELIEDLDFFESVLARAKEMGARWQFWIDF